MSIPIPPIHIHLLFTTILLFSHSYVPPWCHPLWPHLSAPIPIGPLALSISGEAGTSVAIVATPAKFQSNVDCKVIVGQITWKPSTKSWEATYKNSKKENCVEAIELEQGNFKETRKRAYDTAVSFWNEHDKSTKPRIQ